MSHESFDPNESFLFRGSKILPLTYAMTTIMTRGHEGLTDDALNQLCKLEILLDAGADPELPGEDDFPSPLDGIKNMLSHYEGLALGMGRRILDLMEDKIAEE